MDYKELKKQLKILGFHKRKYVDKGSNLFYAEDMKDNLPEYADMLENTNRILKVFEIADIRANFRFIFLLKYKNSYYLAHESYYKDENVDLTVCRDGKELEEFFLKIKRIMGGQ